VIGLGHYLALSGVLFSIGAAGFAARRNLIVALMSIEIMLNAVNLTFVAANRFRPENHAGQAIAFFTIAIAAAEAAVGLAIVVSFYRLKKTIRTDEADQMRG
jgi:NADH-quinone oxidoreductase subunit K